MKEKFSWKIECAHTPETIDRILLPIRKRGLTLNSFTYKKVDDKKAECTFEVEIEPTETERIHLNLLRIYDIDCVTKL
ncbi:hypothetical protein RCC89_17565 [Cytophagaceae bacterium ABcell3]|nr:hypothetical protein RCC89_17565 [Cytophagaceae bacterium ABcell3]